MILKNGNDAAIKALLEEIRSTCPLCAQGIDYNHDLERHMWVRDGMPLTRRCQAAELRYRLAELFVDPVR